MVKKIFEDIGVYCDYLCSELKNYLEKNNIKNVVVGISGGIDSAVTLALLTRVLDKESIYAYNLMIDRPACRKEIESLFEKFNVEIEMVDLSTIYDAYCNLSSMETISNRILGNIKSRIRMNYLYAMAGKYKGIVIGSLNFTEYYLGYFTKFGDSASDFNLLSGLIKGDVYLLAQYLEVPKIIIEKIPTADLLPNQTDEKDLGITYSALDAFAMGEIISSKDNKIAKQWHNSTNHKRKNIKIESYRKYAIRG